MTARSSAFDQLERVFHERGRLAICSALVAHPEGLSFRVLQETCDLTDGNLNRHLHALAALEIVSMTLQDGEDLIVGRRLRSILNTARTSSK